MTRAGKERHVNAPAPKPRETAQPSGSSNPQTEAQHDDESDSNHSSLSPVVLSSEEIIRERAELLQGLVDLHIDDQITPEQFTQRLRDNNFTLEESRDALEQAVSRRSRGEGKGKNVDRGESSGTGQPSGSGLDRNRNEDSQTRDTLQAASEADWAIFAAKARASAFRPPEISSTMAPRDFSFGHGVSPSTWLDIMSKAQAGTQPTPGSVPLNVLENILRQSVQPSASTVWTGPSHPVPPVQAPGSATSSATAQTYQPNPPNPLPQAVVAGGGIPSVPFSAMLQTLFSGNVLGAVDPHIQETTRIMRAYSSSDKIDQYIDLLQLAKLEEPLVRSTWKKILQDQYVDFEKLYAFLENLSMDFDDDGREFTAGYVIVKKDHITSKKRFTTESEWLRLFNAWREAHLLVYPHRIIELEVYRRFIVDIFREFPFDPAVAIGTDHQTRHKYHRSRFRMDDKNELQRPFMSQVSLRLGSGPSSAVTSGRRPARANIASSSRTNIPCENWNLAICAADNCRRRHGVCSECGGAHRAKDSSDCHNKLLAKRESRARARSAPGPSSSSRTQTN